MNTAKIDDGVKTKTSAKQAILFYAIVSFFVTYRYATRTKLYLYQLTEEEAIKLLKRYFYTITEKTK